MNIPFHYQLYGGGSSSQQKNSQQERKFFGSKLLGELDLLTHSFFKLKGMSRRSTIYSSMCTISSSSHLGSTLNLDMCKLKCSDVKSLKLNLLV